MRAGAAGERAGAIQVVELQEGAEVAVGTAVEVTG